MVPICQVYEAVGTPQLSGGSCSWLMNLSIELQKSTYAKKLLIPLSRCSYYVVCKPDTTGAIW